MNEKKGLIISLAILAVVLIAGGVAIYFLEFDYLAKLRQDLQAVNVQVDEATKKKNKVPKLREMIEELKKQEKAKIVKIPNLDRAEYDTLANMLDEIRKRAGVAVSKGTWQAPRAQGRAGKPIPGTVHKVEYNLGAEGTFYQLLRYVNLLEQQKRFISIDSIAFGKGTESGPSAQPSPGRTVQARQTTRRDLKIVLSSYTTRPQDARALLPQKVAEERAGKSTEIPD